ncbi:MlaC/ttg2D family ABC transporter substrate-binding protein [Pseudomonas sp. HK3]|jgi:phospholipid transport system substrate-binding protein
MMNVNYPPSSLLLRHSVSLFVMVISLLCSSISFADSNPQQAHRLIAERIDKLLAEIQSSKQTKTLSDEQKIALVDHKLGEIVDFKRIARRVMAKHFKRATKEQRQRFLIVFKSSLLNTYAKGLWEFNNYKVNVLPLKEGKQTQRNTQVGIEVITSGGQVFPVTQSLFYDHKENKWMVQNVIINGINMGLLFRDQFSRLVAQSNGNIDLAISGWTSEVSNDKANQDTTDDEQEDE